MKKQSVTENAEASIRPAWTSLAAWGVFVLATMAVTLGLARWQWNRSIEKLAQKEAAQRQHQAPLIRASADLPQRIEQYSRLLVKGRWLGHKTLFLDNQVWQGQAGYFVLTPFLIEGERDWLVVNRGWMPKRFGTAPRLPSTPVEERELALEVRAWPNQRPLLQQGRVIQGLDTVELARYWGHSLHAQWWLELGEKNDGLVRFWPVPGDEEITKHRSYMGQWILFTLMIFGAYCFYVWKRWTR